MSRENKHRLRLVKLLKELFQLNQPDLDFGFYRIMHAKAEQVSHFIEKDLLQIIQDAFGEENESLVAEKKAAYDLAIQQAKEFGIAEPETTEPVKKARIAYQASKDIRSNESDIYDHLYRFLERYFDNGDFMSRRYFVRETDSRAYPYAVPYDGREVSLHWANRDQYYIKTSEYLSNFTFDPVVALEFTERNGQLFQDKSLKVHCRVVSATEGEHNNSKESEQTERYFIIHHEEPIKLETGDSGTPELVIQFKFCSDPEKIGQDATWRKKRLEEASLVIKEALLNLDGGRDFRQALMTPAPTDKEKNRTLLDKYLLRYTGRNTMDYFIHKDLGSFLRRELDFYIKNEVMRLDDIETAEVPNVESYLAKIKVFRKIAQQLIDFLAQLEDFQKRLYLKKKFVLDAEYCVTLDRVPEDLFPEIIENLAQQKEWVQHFGISEISGYSEPLTIEFLSENKSLPVDTVFFSSRFKEIILSTILDLDRQLIGTMFQANNASALSLMEHKYARSAKAIYIDPPYNTESNSILYKNSYKHSSWLALMSPLLVQSKKLELPQTGVHAVSIDKAEVSNLLKLFQELFWEREIVPVSVIHNPSGTMGKNFSGTGEFCIFSYDDRQKCIALENRVDSPDVRDFMNTAKGSSGNHLRHTGKTCFYAVIVKNDRIVGVGDVEPDDKHPSRNEQMENGVTAVYPVDFEGNERKWVLGRETVEKHLDELSVKKDSQTGELRIVRTKSRLNYKTVWTKKYYSAKKYGTELLGHMVPETRAMTSLYPKSIYLVKDIVLAALGDLDDGIVIDYFAGSGTTGHCVIQINRELGTTHKFLLVEMGEHFDSVLRPRVLKSAYASNWKDGKPVGSDSISYTLKYLRLETYEDTLNNLAFRDSLPNQAEPEFFREYMLRYWLDFDTKDSLSLLNLEKFSNPTDYSLMVKSSGLSRQVAKTVDLMETFNWLIGLHVVHIDRWRRYSASFRREADLELPDDINTRLKLDGVQKETDDGQWKFRKVEGYTKRVPGDRENIERTLIIWRNLTGNLEQDNLMLDEWFIKFRSSERYSEFDVIYVNGSNNLLVLRSDRESWKVRLIEETFYRSMWDLEG